MGESMIDILKRLSEARISGEQVTVATMDKRKCKGTIKEIIPGQVKPFADRSVILVQTKSGIKRIPGYAITRIAAGTN
ncbi:hypothetical protein [Lacticaseibacillus hulanensis]|jgi:hypothetical protein|uniref:hypothetical protein n=1 Tax=Lacticaseibacillus hulanensis TaxID=2493111 RepID=UPI000FDA0F69|nr:hypothetical protein [Lacticaseibacillus hulanensis]